MVCDDCEVAYEYEVRYYLCSGVWELALPLLLPLLANPQYLITSTATTVLLMQTGVPGGSTRTYTPTGIQ